MRILGCVVETDRPRLTVHFLIGGSLTELESISCRWRSRVRQRRRVQACAIHSPRYSTGEMFLARLCVLFVALTIPCSAAVEIIAHRGASHDAPENTLAAMKLAWEQGADAIEVDLHLSKDGEIVVMHDADAKRTGGLSEKIANLTMQKLAQLDVGAWMNPRFAGERIPSLESILRTVGAGKRVFIEIKCGPEILPRLKEVLAQAKLPAERAVIIGFGLETMARAKAMFPDLKVFFLHGVKKNQPIPPIEQLVEKARAAKLDGLNLHHQFPVSPAFAGKVREAGLQLYVWTVDDPIIARRWIDAGVAGVTTNRPAWLREQLGHVDR